MCVCVCTHARVLACTCMCDSLFMLHTQKGIGLMVTHSLHCMGIVMVWMVVSVLYAHTSAEATLTILLSQLPKVGLKCWPSLPAEIWLIDSERGCDGW